MTSLHGPISNETLWYTSRATGVVSMVLLTLIMILGMVITSMRRPYSSAPTVVMALHRWLSLGTLGFLALHVGTAIAETYVKIDLIAAVVPMASEFQPKLVGLGAVALDLLLALIISSLLRHRLPERGWKLIHFTSYLMWPAALLHGFQLGTSDEPLLRAVTVACAVLGVMVLGWRLFATTHDRRRREDVDAGQWR